MNSLYEKKEVLLKFYAERSRYINIALKFLMTLCLLLFLNANIGFVPLLKNPLVVVGLSAICGCLPYVAITLILAALTIWQFYSWAMGSAVVVAIIFVLMFILSLRFTPKRVVIVLVTPIALMLKLPVLVPIVCGLIGGPLWAIPVAVGTIVYYMIYYVNAYGVLMSDIATQGFILQISTYISQLMGSKELMLSMSTMMLVVWIVYLIRRMSVDNAWKIAVISGAVANIIMMIAGGLMLGVKISYLAVILGSIISIAVALVLEFFVFSVDYSRTEYLQFEDDEYYYYVKAIPKISVATPEKQVKRIHARQETTKMAPRAVNRRVRRPELDERDSFKAEADELILAKSLQDELDIQKLIEDELNN